MKMERKGDRGYSMATQKLRCLLQWLFWLYAWRRRRFIRTASREKPGDYVLLHDLEHTFLQEVEVTAFEPVRTLQAHANSLIWVKGGEESPKCGPIEGLLRVARNENSQVALISLELNPGADPARRVRLIVSMKSESPACVLTRCATFTCHLICSRLRRHRSAVPINAEGI
ncbi:hypothetical protein BCR34DRAFT_180488 [Clohesyomyces aquaticus]|uniref:HRPKS sdrA-like NAD(P)-binding domain-containing protein n=1 Tax=Clohesyomyces aquaticus TaxID=1231657 RepID=A0A1Y1YET4_9PLEO|nr:hypothetical protein BCR34DRAFT_180488 [Clohesyomyces aquaticus]